MEDSQHTRKVTRGWEDMKLILQITLPLSLLYMAYGVVMMVKENELLFYVGFVLFFINTVVYFYWLINITFKTGGTL